MNQFNIECLNAHNRYRAQHGAPPLEWDQNLCNFATQWAQHLLQTNTMQHRSNNKYGENLYMAWGTRVSGETAVKAWYDEVKSYNFARGGFSSQTGHFTQVVWKKSQRLGVGLATNGQTTFVVANYDPPGNYNNEYQQNVSPKVR